MSLTLRRRGVKSMTARMFQIGAVTEPSHNTTMRKRDAFLPYVGRDGKLILNRYDLTRFWDKVKRQKGDGCWLWTAFLKENGYGEFAFGRAWKDYAHRLSYRMHCGNIPNDIQVNHECDTPNCIRPSHLWLGTQLDNMRDCADKGRSLRGIRNVNAKLTEKQVLEIRAKYKAGFRPQWLLGEQYGVLQPIISTIVNRVKWRHLK